MGWTLNDIPDFSGKVMIVTGANSGLGFETTKELSRKGAKVVMACRNPKKANNAVTRKLWEVSEELTGLHYPD